MNFFTKIHELLRQKEQIVKKPQKHDANVQKNSTLYFQVGLIICLLATNALFEMYFETQVPEYTVTKEIIDEPLTVTPVIYKKPVAMVKQKAEPVIKTKRLVKPPVIVPDTDNTLEKETPVVETPPEEVFPEVTPPPLVDTKKNYNLFEVNQLPVFPACEGIEGKDEQIKCFSKKVNKLVQRKFDSYLPTELGLREKQTIHVQFTIDALGNVSEIKTKAKHPRLEREAKRVINKIPKLKPGKYADTPVKVVFALPITLQAQ